ncbi:MAG TPA: hypothetical protein VMV10_11410 [Pirellulales bacterium]|nr:hypothetical protein [Pirellulales bacterium]
MKEQPPQGLVDLLARLGLAREEQVRAVGGRVRRLVRDLPAFESVWVDAMAQARILTPYQAVEINAGRGSGLLVGRSAIHEPLRSPGYARVYRAWDLESRRWVRLTLFEVAAHDAAELYRRLKTLVRLSAKLPPECRLLPVVAHGAEGDTMWTVARDVRGQTAAEWMTRHGRFPPAAVADIARQMLAALVVCEQGGIVHGGLNAGQLWLDAQGQVWLPEPGLRPAVRPEEGFGHAELPPEAFDGLAPERVATGGPADRAGDLYACGCLWWQLQAGRPAIPGATGLAKVRAAQTAKIADIRSIAPDVDAALAEAIAQSTCREPQGRPGSFQAILEHLGAGSRRGRRELVQAVRRFGYSFRLSSPIAAVSAQRSRFGARAVVAAGLLAALAVGVWPLTAAWLNRANRPAAEPAGISQLAVLPGGAVEPGRIQPDRVERTDRTTSPRADVVQASWTPPENVLELASNQPQRLAELALSAGQTVRGRGGRRPRVIVPPGGLEIDVEDVRFENVDFMGGPPEATSKSRLPTIIRLRALRASFVGCSFQSAAGGNSRAQQLPAAVEWLGRPAADGAELELPTGSLSLERCVFHRVSSAVRCRGDAALSFELSQVLHLGPGPLLVLEAAPQADEPVSLVMSHLTLRGAAGLMECRYGELDDAVGRIAIQASNCAFVPAEGKGLFLFRGDSAPGPLVEQLAWSGQGSVLARDAPLALWEAAQGRVLAAAEESIQVAGLVRTDVGFAGEADEGPGASRIVRWQVPLASTDPPGIGEGALELPKLEGP